MGPRNASEYPGADISKVHCAGASVRLKVALQLLALPEPEQVLVIVVVPFSVAPADVVVGVTVTVVELWPVETLIVCAIRLAMRVMFVGLQGLLVLVQAETEIFDGC